MSKSRLLVDFVADPVCPWCYVGMMSFRKARDALSENCDVVPRFRAYQLNPDVPAEGVDRHAYYARKFPDPERLAGVREAIRKNARRAGFSFDPAPPPILPNTLKAHQLIRFAHSAGVAEAAALGAYRAFWDELKNIGDDAVLIDIAKGAGIDAGEAFRVISSPSDAAAVAEEADAFRRAGVSGVPTFIVNERIGFSGGMPPDDLAQALRRAAADSGVPA